MPLGLDPETSLWPRRGDRLPIPIVGGAGGNRRGRCRALPEGGGANSRCDHDHRPGAEALLLPRRRTLSAQAKGAGMMEPGLATMLCFVQTDAVVEDPAAALRGAVDASFHRITVDGQMSTNDTVLLQATGARAAAARRAAGGGAAAAGDRDRPPTARARPGRPDRGQRAPPPPARRSASPAPSPTRRWSRRPSSAATPTGAGSPRRPARRSPARTWRRSAPTRSTPPSSGPRPTRPRSGCGWVAASTAPTSGSPTSATSTCGSTRSTRLERRRET